jgi:hypothetical protein
MAQLRKRGLVAAVVCSDPFLRLGQAQAKTFGVPDLPLLRIPHPLGGIGIEQVQGRVEAALPMLLQLVKEHAQ